MSSNKWVGVPCPNCGSRNTILEHDPELPDPEVRCWACERTFPYKEALATTDANNPKL